MKDVERAAGGDDAAFGRLVEIYWFKLLRIARSIVGLAEAEDMVQEGFVIAWRKLRSLKNPDGFSAWIARIVINKCLRHARRQATMISFTQANEKTVYSSPDAQLDVVRLLSLLAPRQRAVLHLTEIEGMTDSEISSMLKIRKSSVRAHRRRARNRLKGFLKET